MAETYGTIGILPLKEWDATTQYDLLNLVSYNGSSYVAHKKPPVGTFPTDTAYWQVSAQGSNKATASALGVVKPDGKTITVDGDGVIAAKTATQDTTGIVKGSTGIKVGTDGSIDVDTAFTEAIELANIIAGEAIAQVLGKVSKAIATTMNLDQNALLKNMLTGIDVNDANKVPNMALIHTLIERIGMGTSLGNGFANLTAGLNSVKQGLDDTNSNLGTIEEYAIISNHGDVNTETSHAIRVGKIVIVNIYMKVTSQIPAWENFVTFSMAYPSRFPYMSIVGHGSGDFFIPLQITNGNAAASAIAIAAGREVRFSYAYFIK